MTGKDIPALTSLRFFAAALVVIFHYPGKQDVFPQLFWRFGYEAVTFFFVLSGFILTYARAPAGSRGRL